MASVAQNLTPTACRLNAHECRVNADRINPLKREFLALAEGWEDLADGFDRLNVERAEFAQHQVRAELDPA
jgi:hypothetical protein